MVTPRSGQSCAAAGLHVSACANARTIRPATSLLTISSSSRVWLARVCAEPPLPAKSPNSAPAIVLHCALTPRCGAPISDGLRPPALHARPVMRRRFFLTANAGAGLTSSPLLVAVVRALLREGAQLTLTQPGSIEAAREQVREAAASGRFDAILAAGGDGTIRQVAAALIGTGAPLGIVPMGT